MTKKILYVQTSGVDTPERLYAPFILGATAAAMARAAIKAGVKMMVCEQSCMLFNLPRGSFVGDAGIVGAATLNDLILESDAVLSF